MVDMTAVKKLLSLTLLMTSAFFIGCASKPVTQLSTGDSLDLTGIKDQNDNPFTHQDTMKTLLFVSGMEAKERVYESFEGIDTACLNSGKLVYLANISGMPSIISQLVAVPKLRDYAYPIWLDWEGDATAALPVRDDQVTVLSLDGQVITSTEFVEDSETLSQRLIDLCGPGDGKSSQSSERSNLRF